MACPFTAAFLTHGQAWVAALQEIHDLRTRPGPDLTSHLLEVLAAIEARRPLEEAFFQACRDFSRAVASGLISPTPEQLRRALRLVSDIEQHQAALRDHGQALGLPG